MMTLRHITTDSLEIPSIIIYDRNTGFGQKAGDADLFGIPNRIIISDKTIEKGGYELKKRTETEGVIIAL